MLSHIREFCNNQAGGRQLNCSTSYIFPSIESYKTEILKDELLICRDEGQLLVISRTFLVFRQRCESQQEHICVFMLFVEYNCDDCAECIVAKFFLMLHQQFIDSLQCQIQWKVDFMEQALSHLVETRYITVAVIRQKRIFGLGLCRKIWVSDCSSAIHLASTIAVHYSTASKTLINSHCRPEVRNSSLTVMMDKFIKPKDF